MVVVVVVYDVDVDMVQGKQHGPAVDDLLKRSMLLICSFIDNLVDKGN